MHEHHLPVTRSARFYTLGSLDDAPRDVWIACHGYAQLAARFLRHFAPIQAISRLVVAPEALNRFYFDPVFGQHGPDAKVGATWMTREDRLRDIADYIAYLDALHDAIFARIDRAGGRLTVLGFSQGVATVARWAAFGRVRPDHLVLWGGTLPPEIDEAASAPLRSIPRISFVVGERDEQASRVTGADEMTRLAQLGVRPEVIRFDGGHELHAPTLQRLAG